MAGLNGEDEQDGLGELDLDQYRSRTDDTEAIEFFPPNYRIGRTKYVFVTGGVMSGVGKGVFSASLGHLLRHYDFTVSQIKMDGYLNQDAGTINPYRHGEVFVLKDGTECDMDLGTYERFLDDDLNKFNYITSGKVYRIILDKERRGEYLGRDVQVVPHVTGEIKYLIRTKAHEGPYDVVVVEIGGTVGDIENIHFIEAAREMLHDEGRENVRFVHVTAVLYNESTGELKSKPTQHSVKTLLQTGVQPDIIVCRSAIPLNRKIRQKISLYCNVSEDHVISSPDTDSIYRVPSLLDEQNTAQRIAEGLRLNLPHRFNRSRPFDLYLKHLSCSHKEVRIAITGKYTALHDSYVSIMNALEHCEVQEDITIKTEWIDTTEYANGRMVDAPVMEGISGIIVPGGFGERGAEGKIAFIRYARENGIPFLGLCYGFQLAVVEFARNVCGLSRASHTEYDPDTDTPIIYLLPEQRHLAGMGATMRLGGHAVKIKRGTLAYRLYGQESVVERFRHRYEFNNDYRDVVEKHGMIFSGMTPDEQIMQILEISGHPYFVGTQFHPEFTGRPYRPQPLFLGFARAARIDTEEMAMRGTRKEMAAAR
ncbi:MAG: CTP synthase (glutamine hydrolyzing) [candidate division Zixibacteria bacterium]|nr:CTP synthase (glutamine hydrolyzing) [candidate division Zixibacteria bacterium]